MESKASLSSTGAALLGLLAARPATPYELTREVRRNLRHFWPRAASHVYREVKRLAAAGLADTEPGRTGRRPRTMYRITPAGRAALAAWLSEPSGGVSLEHEPLLRVFLAARGTREDVIRALERCRSETAEMLAAGEDLAGEYLAGTHELQGEVHIRALTFDYLHSWARLTEAWIDRTERELGRWDDLTLTRAKEQRALNRIRTVLGRPATPPVAGPRE